MCWWNFDFHRPINFLTSWGTVSFSHKDSGQEVCLFTISLLNCHVDFFHVAPKVYHLCKFLTDSWRWRVVSSQREKQWWFTSGNLQRTFPAEGKFKNKANYHCALLDPLKPSGNTSQTAATQNSLFYRRLLLIFFVCSSENSGIISVNNINWFSCIMKIALLFCEVRTEFLFTLNSAFKDLMYYIWNSHLLNISNVENGLTSCKVPLILSFT
jgi:hypothetical protein